MSSSSIHSILQRRGSRRRVILVETLDSTSLELKRLLARDPGPAVVAAWEQTAGRGRGRSAWYSPPGVNLYFSMTVDVSGIEPASVHLVSAAAGVGLHRALSAHATGDLTLKWPNDLYLNGRKLAGILSEVVTDPGGRPWALCGLGVNVNAEIFPPELARKATSLRIEEKRDFDLQALLADAVLEIDRAAAMLGQGGAEPLLEEYRRRCTLWGRAAAVDGLEGVMEGISPRGGLLVRLKGGALREIMAGSVELL
jgi:BirA family biotin operon repressor/biotin-[acetyl-CoA-carboxylase] ligase